EDDPDRPSSVDDSYVWGTPDLGQPVTVTPAGQQRPAIIVGNPVNRITGSFGVTKEVTGDTEGVDPAALYTFGWTCRAADGTVFPDDAPGSFGLTAGSTWNAPDSVPVGSDCDVTEDVPPAPEDASYDWATELTVAGATGSTSGRRISFVLPRTDTPVAVTATNRLTRTKGSFTIAKTSDPADGATVVPGQAIHYTVTVTGAPVGFTSDVVVTDALAGVLQHAEVSDIATTTGAAVLTGEDLVWDVGTVTANATLELTYTATVAADAIGVTLTNTASATGETDPPACGAACTTAHHTPAWTLSKTSDPAPGSVVAPSDTITYTLTATNTSEAQVIGATAVDDLAGLADADVQFTSDRLSRSGDTLTWAIPTLARGEHATVTYTATVRPGADGATLTNRVVPEGAGGSCAGGCTTRHATVEWSLAKSSSPATGSVVAPGDTITYTLDVTNTGPVPVAPTVTDDLAGLVDDAVLGALPAGLARSGDQLTWTVGELGVGESTSISYTVQVAADARGATLRNTAAPASTGGNCVGSCSTVQTTPKWSLAKTSTAGNGATVKPGDTIGYTLSVTNDGPVTLHGAEVTDDLSGVLDDATFGVLPDAAAITGTTLTWQVPDVAPGATVELDYQVSIKPEAVGATLTNTARPTSTGGDCAAGCTTTAHTPKWTLAKTSDPASGSVVAPGQVITYTLTATNAGEGTITGATGVDDLAGVLANADVEFSSSQLTRSGETLTWTIPTLLPGESATVAYTATVKPAASGVTVTNTVAPVGAGGSCLGCSTSQSTARWGLTKTSNPAAGAVVRPGDTIDYTLTVVNEGPMAVAGAIVADDVAGLVDDADLGALPPGLARSGDQLTWTVPTIAVGGVASVTYSATVRSGAVGATITNSAAPIGPGGHCSISCSTTAWTDGWTLTKTSDPADGASIAPGTVIGYTLSLTNTGMATLHGAVVVDDLADVLDDATLGSLPAGATLTGNTLAWSVPDVPAGETVTLSYAATVNPDATGARLRNVAFPATAGGTCSGPCSSTLHTGAWTLAKGSTPASGTVVEPGDELTYTLTATNTSAATITGAVATDDLGDVLPSAAVDLGSPQLSLTGTTLTWAIPTLAPGQTRTVTYTARVLAGDAGATITNSARPQDVGGSCPSGCVTTHTTPAWQLAKTSNPGSGSDVAPGDVLDYTLSVTNTGPALLTGAVVHDDVSGLVDDASLGALPAGLTRDDDRLTWAVPDVPAGATVSVTYSATVAAGARGATITNTATAGSAGGSCAGSCTTTSHTPSWTLAKTSDQPAGATVHPGDVIGYTLTVTNTGPATLHAAQVGDDLSDVLDDAVLLAVPDGATPAGTTLTWAVPDVAAGSTVELSYEVRVDDRADGARLANSAAPASAGGRCETSCATLALTPAWRLTKTSDPASGAVVAPGDTITYTLTATNTGAAPVTGATATDDLSGVLAAAAVRLDSAELSRTGTTLTWAIPALAPGQTRTVTYSAEVLAAATGATIVNSAAPNGQGGYCGAGCSTTQSTVQWSLAKTSDAAPGAVLQPGDVITYTLTATNTGPVPVSGAAVTDDITDITDEADLGELPAGLSRSADTLSWAVPELAVGGSRSVSYSATIRSGAWGATLRNSATPASTGGTCNGVCTTVQYTPRWTLAKTSGVGPGGTVQPGDTVDYTLTVTNDGPATLHDAVVVDDASGLLAAATLVAVPAGVSRLGDQLTWNVPEVAPGATVALTYQVVVAADVVGATLANTAAPASPGGTCAGTCATVAHTPAWTLAKTSDPADGATVQPGDAITYTLTATNTSEAEIRGALALDDLSGLLAHADVSFTSPQLARSGDLLTWAIPTLARGESASVTYTAVVGVGADGVTLTNSVVPVGAGGSCIGGCATSQSTAGWTLAKTSDPGTGAQVLPGDEIHYTLTVTNTGPVPVTGALVADDLTEVLDDALVTDLGAGLSRTGSTLVWVVPDIPVGGSASVGYTATVGGGSVGATITNAAAPVGSGGRCLTCTTTQTTPGWTLAKTSDPADGATVEPGHTVAYTLTVTNTGPGTLTGAVVTDDLAGVLDDATLGALPAGASRLGDQLTWTVPDIAPGGTATLSYAATVQPTAVGATLHNSAAPASPGGTCAPSCSTTAHTPAWTLAKTSSPGDGAAVVPGDVITYTLTATNTSAAVVSGATAVDNLADVLDDAGVAATADGLVLAGDELTWAIPTLEPGTTASVSYSAVVRADGATITNTVAPFGAGGSCTACSTTQTSPSWTLVKRSNPASGSVVEPGDQVGYTLTVVNIGPAALAGAQVADDVSGLVDGATLGVLPAGVTRTGNLLRWAVPTVPAGGTASVTYTATAVTAGATLTNGATPATPGGRCLGCTTTSYTPKWSLAKTSSPGDGATVAVGSPVGYTLTVTNDGPATLHGAVVSDDLSDVLDDATPAALPAGASLTGTTLTW
ncbi:MAG: DUF11 domain-containing protein, partial [Acidimicrobiales bacterium]|nr:DUF11 domain-containing protein [Acidimicrobiales bacterium]